MSFAAEFRFRDQHWVVPLASRRVHATVLRAEEAGRLLASQRVGAFRVSRIQGEWSVMVTCAFPAEARARQEAAFATWCRDGDWERPEDAAAFDEVVSSVPPLARVTDLGGYHVRSNPIAPEFRLHDVLPELLAATTGDVVYQLGFVDARRDREVERRLRLADAGLETPNALPARIAAYTRSSLRRAIATPWFVQEGIAFGSTEDLERSAALLDAALTEAATRASFDRAPLRDTRDRSFFDSGIVPVATLADSHATAIAAACRDPETIARALDLPGLGASPERPPADGHAVFLSHASDDALTASNLCEALESGGVRCWIAPRDVPAGTSYPRALAAAIERTVALAVIVTPAAARSSHVEREVESAMKAGKLILPLRLPGADTGGGLAYLLTTTQWITATTPAEAAALIRRRLADRIGDGVRASS